MLSRDGKIMNEMEEDEEWERVMQMDIGGSWTSRSNNIDALPYLALKVIARIIDSP